MAQENVFGVERAGDGIKLVRGHERLASYISRDDAANLAAHLIAIAELDRSEIESAMEGLPFGGSPDLTPLEDK